MLSMFLRRLRLSRVAPSALTGSSISVMQDRVRRGKSVDTSVDAAGRSACATSSRTGARGHRPSLVLCAAFCLSVFGQAPTIPELSRARDAAQKSRTLTDTEKKQVTDLYGKAIQSLESAVRLKAAQLGQERLRASLEGERAVLHGEVLKPAAGAAPPPKKDETAQQVQEALSLARTERSSRSKAIGGLTIVSTDLNSRREAIQKRRADILSEVQALDDQLAAVALTAVSPEWAAASKAQIQARKQELEQEQASLSSERDALEIRRTLIPVQREHAQMRLEAAEQSIAELKNRLETATRQDALRELQRTQEAAQKAASFSPVLAPTAQEVRDFASRLWSVSGVLDATQRTAVNNDRLNQQANRLVQIIANTRRLYESFPPLSPSREWMRQIPHDLPSIASVGLARVRTLSVLPALRREVLGLEDQRVSEAAIESQIQELKNAAARSGKPPNAAEFETQARSLLQLRRNLIEELLEASQNYERVLNRYDESSAKVLYLLGDLLAFVSGRILWTRSVAGDLIPSGKDILGGLAWFALNPDWPGLFRALLPWQSWYPWLIAFVVLLYLLFRLRPRLRSRLQASAGALSDPAKGKFRPLRAALVSTALLAAAWPAVLLLIRWMLLQVEDYSLARALAFGLKYAVGSLFTCLFFREALKDGSLAEVQLGWSQPFRQALSAPLRWLTPAVPTLYLMVMALAQEGALPNADLKMQAYHDSLGRLCFLAMLGCLLWAGRRALRPEGAVAAVVRERISSPRGFYWRLLSRPFITVLLLAPILLALMGYYFTALLFTKNMLHTAALTVALGFTSALIFRWRYDQRLRLTAPVDRSGKDVAELSERQVRQLSFFGLTLLWIVGGLWIWSAALPSLTMLRQVQLLPTFQLLPQKTAEGPDQPQAQVEPAAAPAPAAALPLPVPAAKPATPAEPAPPSSPLLLYDVVLAGFVGLLVILFVKNVPGLLEFTVMRRFAFDAGAKYAFSSIARYIVIIIGVSIVSAMLGVEWSKVQWLAAALTFGIGFGLQEIFANFASGLILLFDRSVRVGDAVSVGDLSGRVAQIQMRATTITLWDRSEMIVPNKQFITSQLVNWTLSYPETRVDVKVGVAYASDTDLVRRLLLEIGNANPHVLRLPPPEVFLTQFADSAILFELRVFCLYEYGRLLLLDELHTAVLREFRANGISIAFPQIDVHVKTEGAGPFSDKMEFPEVRQPPPAV
jgi:potassium-dependent mechanosensitive channel